MHKQNNKVQKQRPVAKAPKTSKKVNKVQKRKMASRVSKKAYIQQSTDELLANAQKQKTDLYAPAEFFQTYKTATLVIPQFQEVISHPMSTPERKREVIADVFTHLGADKPTIEFFSKLAVDDRLPLAKDSLDKYRKMAADLNKDALATVTSAVTLTDAQIKGISKSLEAVTPKGHKLRVFTHVDPKILGGLIIKMDSFYQDLSMASAYQVIEQKVQDATAV
jgi:F-type H+-transporting ATPase subunit delta